VIGRAGKPQSHTPSHWRAFAFSSSVTVEHRCGGRASLWNARLQASTIPRRGQ